MPYWGWIVIGVAAAMLLVAAILVGVRANRTKRLRDAFGPEYDRTVDEAGSRDEAEAELRERQERHDELDLRPLAPDVRERYLGQWRVTQERFVDDPRGATVEADHLVHDVMRARGYPVEDIDRRAADISVDYPELVANYRAAHQITVEQSSGDATTEDLRNAMRHYRALFDELLETDTAERVRVRGDRADARTS
jgi:hypothetical protein